MKDNKILWHPLTYAMAFLIGVILFWSFGKFWLDMELGLVFLAGLVGVAVFVLAFCAWNLRQHFSREDKPFNEERPKTK